MATAKTEDQLTFETVAVQNPEVADEIAKNLANMLDCRPMWKSYNKSNRKVNELLPVGSIEEPTKITVTSVEHGSYVVTVTPMPRQDEITIPAGMSLRKKFEKVG